MSQSNKILIVAFLIFSGAMTLIIWNKVDSRGKTTLKDTERNKILEINNYPFGPIYPPEKTLVLRVFSNGEIEFDYYPQYGPDLVGVPFKSELRSSLLTIEELDSIKALLKELNSEESKSEYGPTKKILDCKTTVTVEYESQGQAKQINLIENDSHLHLEASNNYPTSLKKLIALVEKINWDNLQRIRNDGKQPI